MVTYNQYLENKGTIHFHDMVSIHEKMLENINKSERTKSLYKDYIKHCNTYAKIRADWNLLSLTQKAEQDSFRTSCHDSVIIYLNMITRCLETEKLDVSWRKQLGYTETDPTARKRIGDFACFIAFVEGINAR